jgi:hypothetical protein
MGWGQSKIAGQQQQFGIPAQMIEANTYSKRAALSKELANKILTIYFERADFTDVLEISSIASCPRYVFTTAKALGHMLQTIQIDPRLGKDGEILFAPISKLSPGLLSNTREGSQNLVMRTQERNRMCIDVAYLYVRIFQMYAALSMTILDADPVRRRYFYGSISQQPDRQLAPAGPTRAIGFGGGGGGEAPKGQTGGKLSSSFADRLSKTPFVPLIPYFSDTSTNIIQMDDKRYSSRGVFKIGWEDPLTNRSSLTLDAIYRKKTSSSVSCKVKMEYTDSDREEIVMYIDGNAIQVFRKIFGDEWVFKYENDESDNPEQFIKNVHEYFLDSNSKNEIVKRAAVAKTSTGISLTSGKSSFNSFDQIKKVYQEHTKGAPFPKAYCIARAMTLLTPIFPSEVGQGGAFYSQICRPVLDFENKGAEYMPRAGKQPKANIYLRSLVSLYFDDYTIRGNEVEFKQSEESRARLHQGSTLFAKLHNITTNPESFLESSTQFKPLVICKKDTLLQIKDNRFRVDLYENVIKKMIKFQEDHTQNVNKLLNRMFKILMDPVDGKPTMKFGDELKAGGRLSVNKFGEEVRNLLLNYYLVSESYYIMGVKMLSNNPNTWTAL